MNFKTIFGCLFIAICLLTSAVQACTHSPSASITITSTSGDTVPIGETVNFSGDSSTPPAVASACNVSGCNISSYSWSWTAADGTVNTGSGSTFSAVFDDAGDFNVTLNVTCDDGVTSADATEGISAKEVEKISTTIDGTTHDSTVETPGEDETVYVAKGSAGDQITISATPNPSGSWPTNKPDWYFDDVDQSSPGSSIQFDIDTVGTTIVKAECGTPGKAIEIEVVEPETLILTDKMTDGDSKDDQTDSSATVDTLYLSVADDGTGDVEFEIIGPATGATYPWEIQQGGTAITGGTGTLGSSDYDAEKTDLDPGEYTLVVSKTGEATYERKINFTVFKVDITDSDDNEITSLTTVSVGEKVELKTKITPSGLTVTNWQWTIPGTRVKNYTMAQASATKTDLASTDLDNSTVEFYWVTGGNPVEVSVSFKVNSVDYSDDVDFDVQRPTMASFESATSTVGVVNAGSSYVLATINSATTTIPGFQVEIDTTQPSDYGGAIKVVQLCESNCSRTKTDDTVEVMKTTGSWFDTFGGVRNPYPNVNLTYDTGEFNDTPILLCPSGYKELKADDSFKVYMMYKPATSSGGVLTPIPNAIWVPLGKLEWGWSGTAESTDGGATWTLTEGEFDEDNPDGSTSEEFPEWSDYIDQGSDPKKPDWVAEE